MLKNVGFKKSRGRSSLCQGGVARRQVVGVRQLEHGDPEEDRFQQMSGFRFHFPPLPLYPAPSVIPFQGLFLYQMCPN